MRKRFSITLNSTTYDKIKELAEQDRRSIANKIECILEDYLARPGGTSTPYYLHYPEGVRSPIQETPYKITCENENQTKPKRRSIIGGSAVAAQSKTEQVLNRSVVTDTNNNLTSNMTFSGHKKHPLVWLDENNIDPKDISESAYNQLHTAYPNVEIDEFVNYQHQRQNIYKPDPNDPYDPMINNPYLKQ